MWRLLLLVVCISRALATVEFTVDEECPRGTPVGNFAQRRGLTQGDYTYTFIPPPGVYDGTKFFKLNPKTSEVKTNSRIDRDVLCRHYDSCCKRGKSASVDCVIPLQIAFRDTSSKVQKVSFGHINVHIKDLNDNVASWASSGRRELVYRIPENAATGSVTALDPAEDPDVGPNGTQHYELRDPTRTFTISRQMLSTETGLGMQLMKPLDREKVEVYNLTLVAFDGATPQRTGSIKVKVIVTDINDHAPRFTDRVYKVHVPENKEIHSQILRVHAEDEDKGSNGQISYSFRSRTPQNVRDMFQIDSTGGRITLTGRLDYEAIRSKPWYTFVVQAKDNSAEPKSATATVSIIVTDVNDCEPKFSIMRIDSTTYQLTKTRNKIVIPENEPEGYTAALASVVDCDSGPAGQAECRIEDEEYLRLQTPRGAPQGNLEFVTRRSFDRDTMSSFSVHVICSDRGSPPSTKTYDILVVIQDKNDNAPVFSREIYTFQVKENVDVGTPVGSVHAKDRDDGRNNKINYKIDAGVTEDASYFRINRMTGRLTTRRALDREDKDEMAVTVIAYDSGNPPKSATASILVRVEDVNDQSPKFERDHYKFTLLENQPPNTLIGRVKATDGDVGTNAKLRFEFDQRNVQEYHQRRRGFPFMVEAPESEPGVGLLRTSQRVDREEARRTAGDVGMSPGTVFTFTLLAKDRGHPPRSASTLVTVIIKDVNDERPRWIFPNPGKQSSVNVSVNAEVGHAIGIVRAVDLDEDEHSKIVFMIKSGDPDNLFALDPHEGTLQVRRKLKKLRSYRLVLSAKDFPSAKPNETRFESYAMLTINVVSSGSGSGGGSGITRTREGEADRDPNVVIIVVLISATAAIAFVLLIVIVVMRFVVSHRVSKMAAKDRATARPLFPAGGGAPAAGGAVREDVEAGKLADMKSDVVGSAGASAFFTCEPRRASTKMRRDLADGLPGGTAGCKTVCQDGSTTSPPAAATLHRHKCNNYQVSTMLRSGGTLHLQPVDSAEESRGPPPAYQTLRPTASTRLLVDSEGHYYDIVKNQRIDEAEMDVVEEQLQMQSPGGCIDSGTTVRLKVANAGAATPTLDLRSYLTREPGSNAASTDCSEEDGSARSTEAKFRAKQRHPIYQASFV